CSSDLGRRSGPGNNLRPPPRYGRRAPHDAGMRDAGATVTAGPVAGPQRGPRAASGAAAAWRLQSRPRDGAAWRVPAGSRGLTMVDVVWSWRRASRAGLALVTVLLLVTVGWTGAAAQPRAAAAGVQPATVMTRNLYLGADLTPLFAAQTPAELVAAATAVWQQVLASDFPARAEALADEVAEQQPLVIGLQEVSLWRTSDVPGQPAQAVALDFLDVYLDALADEGLAYEPVA